MNIYIISCTKSSNKEFNDTPLGKSIVKLNTVLGINITPLVCFNNTDGMPKVYNDFLSMTSGNDRVLFVHDDVYINDIFLADKLEEGFKNYDVLGVAGSDNFSIARNPVCWHNSPRDSWSGAVEHPVKNKSDGQTFVTSFGDWPKRCIVLDGLFIAVKSVDIAKKIGWDEDFEFDFYDASFCLRAHRAGFRLGTVPVSTTHMSHGDGIKKESYKISQELFISKFKNKQ